MRREKYFEERKDNTDGVNCSGNIIKALYYHYYY